MSEWRKVATRIIDQHYYPEVEDTDVRLEEAITDALTEAVAHLEREQAEDRAALREAEAVMEAAHTGLCASPDYQKTPSNRYGLNRIKDYRHRHAAAIARAQEGKG